MTVITVIGALEGLVFAQLVKVSRLYISVVAAGFGLAATLVTIFAQNMALVFLGAGVEDGANPKEINTFSIFSKSYYIS